MEIDTETITLDNFLKWSGLVETGGQAKMAAQLGQVMVNGKVEKRRSRTIKEGDIIEYQGSVMIVKQAGQEV
ncbi:MAG: RNA-binding S4 domain-containing protein [Clostridia bacterium]|nr:RNA-binding S4 domain-containing protein [Clostridia bacterium]